MMFSRMLVVQGVACFFSLVAFAPTVVAESACACSCCHATARPPSMQVRGVDLMCSKLEDPAITGMDCPEDCSFEKEDGSVSVLEYNKFCFDDCVPPSSSVGALCQATPPNVQEDAETDGGNGQDWAANVMPEGNQVPPALDPEVPEAAQASDELAKEEFAAGPSQAATNLEAQQRALEAQSHAMVTRAAGYRATASGIESRVSQAEAKSLQAREKAAGALRGARDAAKAVHHASAELQSSAAQAAIYAHSAAKAAQLAEQELQGLKDASKQAAAEAAAEAVKEMSKEADATEQEAGWIEAKFLVTPIPGMPEASGRAAAPYLATMSRAMGSQGAYQLKADELNTLAIDLQSGAKTLADQAAIYQAAGNTKIASQLHAKAENMLKQAEVSDRQAQGYGAVAASVGATVPKWLEQATWAANRAAALANPTGQPPAVPLPPA